MLTESFSFSGNYRILLQSQKTFDYDVNIYGCRYMNQMKVILFALQSLPLPPLQLYLLVHLWFQGSKFIIYDNVDLETVMIFIMMRKNGLRKSSDSEARIFSGALEPPDTCGSPSMISLTLTLTSLIWHNHTVA